MMPEVTISAEDVARVVLRDYGRCVVCGGTDGLKAVPLRHPPESLSDWATLCPQDAELLRNKRIRVLGSPGAWTVSRFDDATRQWVLRPPYGSTITPKKDAGAIVHVVDNLIPQVYKEIEGDLEALDNESLGVLFRSLESTAFHGFKMRCRIAYILAQRYGLARKATSEQCNAHLRNEWRVVASFLGKYSPRYIEKLARAWEKFQPYWDDLEKRPLAIRTMMTVAAYDDVDAIMAWITEFYDRYHCEPTSTRVELAIESGLPPVELLAPGQEPHIASCRTCAHYQRARENWRLELISDTNEVLAVATPKNTFYCDQHKKLLATHKSLALRMIASRCQHYTPPKEQDHGEYALHRHSRPVAQGHTDTVPNHGC